MEIIRYLLSATVLSGISYLAYRLIYLNGASFNHQRFFLIAIVILSFTLPLAGFRIDIPANNLGKETAFNDNGIIPGTYPSGTYPAEQNTGNWFNTGTVVKVYILISSLAFAIILLRFMSILKTYIRSEKKKNDRYTILHNKEIKSPYSFFRWIFIPSHISDKEEAESIVLHESIHASQYHSADNLIVEMALVVMWFNPLVWAIKRSLHLIHEYLADEGTIGSGIDRLRYQAFLINHVTEEKLILLSSNFNQSLIKKRMKMITNNTGKKQLRGRILILIPLSFLMLSSTAFVNGFFPEKAIIVPEHTYFPVFQEKSPVIVAPTKTQDTISVKSVVVRKSDTLKKESRKNKEVKVIGYANKENNDALIYVVDGVHLKDISTLNPDSIESVNVLKDDNLIIVHTKKNKALTKDVKVFIEKTDEGSPDNVIYIIDDEETTDPLILKKINPDDIESIQVIKGEENMKARGKQGYDGIIIVRKKGK